MPAGGFKTPAGRREIDIDRDVVGMEGIEEGSEEYDDMDPGERVVGLTEAIRAIEAAGFDSEDADGVAALQTMKDMLEDATSQMLILEKDAADLMSQETVVAPIHQPA